MKFFKFEDPFVLIVAKSSNATFEVYDDEIGDAEELTKQPEVIHREEAMLVLSKSTGEGEYRNKFTGMEEATTIIEQAIADIDNVQIGTEFNLRHVLAQSATLC